VWTDVLRPSGNTPGHSCPENEGMHRDRPKPATRCLGLHRRCDHPDLTGWRRFSGECSASDRDGNDHTDQEPKPPRAVIIGAGLKHTHLNCLPTGPPRYEAIWRESKVALCRGLNDLPPATLAPTPTPPSSSSARRRLCQVELWTWRPPSGLSELRFRVGCGHWTFAVKR